MDKKKITKEGKELCIINLARKPYPFDFPYFILSILKGFHWLFS